MFIYDYDRDKIILRNVVESDIIPNLQELTKEFPNHLLGSSVNPYRTAPQYLAYDGYVYKKMEDIDEE